MITTGQSEADEVRANAAITKFLDYYVDPSRPFDYAVMVNGPWGSGKTHLVKEFLKGRSSLKPLYVTLNGISSVDQIEQEFYRLLHPKLSSRGMRIAAAAARALAKGALKMDFSTEESGTLNFSMPEIDLTKDLANPRNRLLIFDDLERCKMPLGEVLGYINGLVEHDGLKAIILANETEIRTYVEIRYDEIREKLIGQTLTVSAPAGEAFDAFVSQVRCDERVPQAPQGGRPRTPRPRWPGKPSDAETCDVGLREDRFAARGASLEQGGIGPQDYEGLDGHHDGIPRRRIE